MYLLFCLSVFHISEIGKHDNHSHAATTSSKHEEVHEGTIVKALLSAKKIVSSLMIVNFILPSYFRRQRS